MICSNIDLLQRQQNIPRRNSFLYPLYSIPEDESVRGGSNSSNKNSSYHSPNRPARRRAPLSDDLSLNHYDHHYRLVNRSRLLHKVNPLQRSLKLDELAQTHAKTMAARGQVHHSVKSVEELQEQLEGTIVGENVQRGQSILQSKCCTCCFKDLQLPTKILVSPDLTILQFFCMLLLVHRETIMLVHSYLRKNLLSGKFNEMGMATAVGPNDGKVYLVQYFRSSNPIVKKD